MPAAPPTTTDAVEGHTRVNGVELYWESRGAGGTPLILVHGGFGLASSFASLAERWATSRRVIAVELQGHGHTPDIQRPFSYHAFGDDLAGLIEALGLEQADVLGYSLGAGASLRCALQHPGRVRRLVLVSFPCRSEGWFPEVRAGMAQVGRDGLRSCVSRRCTPAGGRSRPTPRRSRR